MGRRHRRAGLGDVSLPKRVDRVFDALRVLARVRDTKRRDVHGRRCCGRTRSVHRDHVRGQRCNVERRDQNRGDRRQRVVDVIVDPVSAPRDCGVERHTIGHFGRVDVDGLRANSALVHDGEEVPGVVDLKAAAVGDRDGRRRRGGHAAPAPEPFGVGLRPCRDDERAAKREEVQPVGGERGLRAQPTVGAGRGA